MCSVVSAAEKLLLACYAGPETDALDALAALEGLINESNVIDTDIVHPSSAMQTPPCGDDTSGAMRTPPWGAHDKTLFPPAPHQMMLNAVNIRDVHGGMFEWLVCWNVVVTVHQSILKVMRPCRISQNEGLSMRETNGEVGR